MSSHSLRRLVATLAFVALIGTGCGGADDTETGAATGTEAATADAGADSQSPTPLPDVGGTLVSGGQFELNDLAGQDVVLWFWAPW